MFKKLQKSTITEMEKLTRWIQQQWDDRRKKISEYENRLIEIVQSKEQRKDWQEVNLLSRALWTLESAIPT